MDSKKLKAAAHESLEHSLMDWTSRPEPDAGKESPPVYPGSREADLINLHAQAVAPSDETHLPKSAFGAFAHRPKRN